jgi:hypothetical protein
LGDAHNFVRQLSSVNTSVVVSKIIIMKFAVGVLALLASANAACTTTKEYPLSDATKLSFSGFLPSVKRYVAISFASSCKLQVASCNLYLYFLPTQEFAHTTIISSLLLFRTLNTGVGNKIVFRGYKYDPVIAEGADGVLQVSAGEPCEEVEDPMEGDNMNPPLNPDPGTPPGGESAGAAQYLGWGLASMLMGTRSALAGSTLALGMTVGMLSSAPMAMAQNDVVSECDLAPIEVEIYVDTMSGELVQMEYKTGDYEVCPTESK